MSELFGAFATSADTQVPHPAPFVGLPEFNSEMDDMPLPDGVDLPTSLEFNTTHDKVEKELRALEAAANREPSRLQDQSDPNSGSDQGVVVMKGKEPETTKTSTSSNARPLISAASWYLGPTEARPDASSTPEPAKRSEPMKAKPTSSYSKSSRQALPRLPSTSSPLVPAVDPSLRTTDLTDDDESDDSGDLQDLSQDKLDVLSVSSEVHGQGKRLENMHAKIRVLTSKVDALVDFDTRLRKIEVAVTEHTQRHNSAADAYTNLAKSFSVYQSNMASKMADLERRLATKQLRESVTSETIAEGLIPPTNVDMVRSSPALPDPTSGQVAKPAAAPAKRRANLSAF